MDDDDRLVYAGKVGTGFTETTLKAVRRELDSRARDDSPFHGRQPPKGTSFVEPELVASVEFREWTKSGTLRAPSFKGLRPDKDPAEAVREPQVPARGEGE
jgi:bifunctional non-homologous end joining protein LigD